MGGSPDQSEYIILIVALSIGKNLISEFLASLCYAGLMVYRKGVTHIANQNDSQTVKAGSKTYFFDLKQTKEGQPYLIITESRFMGEDQDRERHSITVFLVYAPDFLVALRK